MRMSVNTQGELKTGSQQGGGEAESGGGSESSYSEGADMFAEMEKGGRSPVYEHVERIRLISELALGAQEGLTERSPVCWRSPQRLGSDGGSWLISFA